MDFIGFVDSNTYNITSLLLWIACTILRNSKIYLQLNCEKCSEQSNTVVLPHWMQLNQAVATACSIFCTVFDTGMSQPQ